MPQPLVSSLGIVEPNQTLDILLVIISVVSILFNGILFFIAVKRQTVTLDSILIGLIAFIDITADTYRIISQVWRWASNDAVLQHGSLWCKASVLLGRAVALSAVDITALLALVRYLVIVRGKQPHRILYTSIALFMLLSLLGLFCLKILKEKPVVYPSGMYCAFQWKTKRRQKPKILTLLVIIYAIPPLIVIPICYYKISRYYKSLVDNMRSFHPDHVIYTSKRRVRYLILIIFAYYLAMLPEYLQSFIHILFGLPLIGWVDAITKLCKAHLHIINALFALLIHSEMRNHFYDLWSY